ncbi:MAG: SLBB domain-containing protein [Ignavibacteriaceae bacterium]|jgi:hypothetical protein|nr:SLBB domain-containing protein [Ignavibacteriaceae bacterium]
MKKFFIIVLFLFSSSHIFSQIEDYTLGSNNPLRNYNGGFYDYSDQDVVNIKVAVWGAVKYPGRYAVPNYITINDLISYSGGPIESSNLEDVRVYRTDENGKQQLLKINLNDLMWEDNLHADRKVIPKLEAGDIVVIPIEPRYYFRQDFSFWLSVISTLSTLTIVILNFLKN